MDFFSDPSASTSVLPGRLGGPAATSTPAIKRHSLGGSAAHQLPLTPGDSSPLVPKTAIVNAKRIGLMSGASVKRGGLAISRTSELASKRRKVVAVLTPPPSSPSSGASSSTAFKVPAATSRPPLAPRSSDSNVQLPSSPSTMRDSKLSSPVPASSPMPFARRRQLASVGGAKKRGASSSAQSYPVIDIAFDSASTLIIGRSRHIAQGTQPLLPSIPPALASHVQEDKPVRFAPLPRGAAHASRHHVVLAYDADSDAVKLVVLGQNGCRVRWSAGNMSLGDLRRIAPSRDEMLVRPSTEVSALEIDFYSCAVRIPWPASERLEARQPVVNQPMSSPLSSPVADRLMLPRESSITLPCASSPLVHHVSLGAMDGSSELSSEGEDEMPDRKILQAVAQATKSPVDVDVKPTIARPDGSSSTPAPRPGQSHSRTHSLETRQAEEPVRPLPEGIDLVALIANTLVFSGHSATALPDLVKSILETQPSNKDMASEAVWTQWVKQVLFSHAMFGKVDRRGKDASGRPLLPLFFYLPSADPDTVRASELGSLVRPLRGVQQRGGKAIDWRPVGGGRRRRDGEGE